MKEEKTDQANVEVFGELVGKENRIDSGRVVWGTIFLLGGLLLLLNNLNLVPWEIWSQIWQYWPAIFILMGFHFIVGDSPVATTLMFIFSLIVLGAVLLLGLAEVHSPLVQTLPPDVTNFLKLVGELKQ